MYTYRRLRNYLITVSLLVFALVACAARPAAAADGIQIVEDGSGTVEHKPLAETSNTLSASGLSEAEVEGILYMREEEKLAHDVYLTLYEQWGIPIFENIARSEATHVDAVKSLLDRYDLQDPAEGKAVGEFADETLQELYDQLVEQGRQSLSDALRVGAAIEEIDILDLEEYVARTDKADIQRVYENLTKGSRNHLRSFVGNLERRTGEIYVPQYLEPAAYEAIVNAKLERGGRGKN